MGKGSIVFANTLPVQSVVHSSKLDCPGLPLDAPSKLRLTNAGIGDFHLTIDLSILVCNLVDVPDPSEINIDFHSQMIPPSQEVIIGLNLHLLTLALVSSKIDFSMIWSTLSRGDTSFLKIFSFLSHQIAQITNAGTHLLIKHWGKYLARLERCPKCYFVME